MPGTPHYREWRLECRHGDDRCEVASLMLGAKVLRAALSSCHGDRAAAVARYRGAGCNARPVDRAVVRRAEFFAWRLKRTDESHAQALLELAENARRLSDANGALMVAREMGR
jgi:hypothetical protein